MQANFFGEACKVTVKGMALGAGVSFEYVSSVKSAVSFAKVKLTTEVYEMVGPLIGDELLIELLVSNGVYETLLKGQVTHIEGAELTVKDDMEKVKNVRVSGTYLNALAEELVNMLLVDASVAVNRIDTAGALAKEKTVVRDMDGVAFLRHVNTLYGLSYKFACWPDGFWWGAVAEQAYEQQYMYGQNIIKHTFDKTFRKILTVPQGIVRPYQKIGVSHPSGSGTYEVHKTKYTKTKGFLRLELWFGEAVTT